MIFEEIMIGLAIVILFIEVILLFDRGERDNAI